jgi:hypothetical protein
MSGTGPIAAGAVRVLQRRMSGAPQKRQLATKIRHVVKGQHRKSQSHLIHLVSSGGGSNAAKPSELCRTSHNKSSASIDQPIGSDCAEFA